VHHQVGVGQAAVDFLHAVDGQNVAPWSSASELYAPWLVPMAIARSSWVRLIEVTCSGVGQQLLMVMMASVP
jgi:hypothetical protein